jgi:hypothetical protein
MPTEKENNADIKATINTNIFQESEKYLQKEKNTETFSLMT